MTDRLSASPHLQVHRPRAQVCSVTSDRLPVRRRKIKSASMHQGRQQDRLLEVADVPANATSGLHRSPGGVSALLSRTPPGRILCRFPTRVPPGTLPAAPFQPAARHLRQLPSVAPQTAPDRVWINHLLIICAMAIQYCYGRSQNTTRNEEIVARRSQWLKCCPPSFSPVYFEAVDHAAGGLFPRCGISKTATLWPRRTSGSWTSSSRRITRKRRTLARSHAGIVVHRCVDQVYRVGDLRRGVVQSTVAHCAADGVHCYRYLWRAVH